MNIQNIFSNAKHVKKEIFCGKVFGSQAKNWVASYRRSAYSRTAQISSFSKNGDDSKISASVLPAAK